MDHRRTAQEEETPALLCDGNQHPDIQLEKKQSDKPLKDNASRQAVEHELPEDDTKDETTPAAFGSDFNFSQGKNSTGKPRPGEKKKLAESGKSKGTKENEEGNADNQQIVDPAVVATNDGCSPAKKPPTACQQSEDEDIDDCSSSMDDLQSFLDAERPCENTGVQSKIASAEANVYCGSGIGAATDVATENAHPRTRPTLFRSISETGSVSTAKLPQEHTWRDNRSSEDESDSEASFLTSTLKANNSRLVEKKARKKLYVRSLPVKRPHTKGIDNDTRPRRSLRSRSSLDPLVSETSSSDDSDSSSSQSEENAVANAERHSGYHFPNRFKSKREPDNEPDPCPRGSHSRDNNQGPETPCEGEEERDVGLRGTAGARISTSLTASSAPHTKSLPQVCLTSKRGQEPGERSLTDTGQASGPHITPLDQHSTLSSRGCAELANMHQSAEEQEKGYENVLEQPNAGQRDQRSRLPQPLQHPDCNASDLPGNNLSEGEAGEPPNASETATSTTRLTQSTQSQFFQKRRSSSAVAGDETPTSTRGIRNPNGFGEEGARATQTSETGPPAQVVEQVPVDVQNLDGPPDGPSDLSGDRQVTPRLPLDTADDQPPGQDRPPPQVTESRDDTARLSGEAGTTERPHGQAAPGPQRLNPRKPLIADAVHLRPIRRRGARGPDVLVQRSLGACAPVRYPRNAYPSTVDLHSYFVDMRCRLDRLRGESVWHS